MTSQLNKYHERKTKIILIVVVYLILTEYNCLKYYKKLINENDGIELGLPKVDPFKTQKSKCALTKHKVIYSLIFILV